MSKLPVKITDHVQRKIVAALATVTAVTVDGIGGISISSRLRALAVAADDAMGQAQRAVVRSHDDLGKVADLVKAIGAQMTAAEETRKTITAPSDAYKRVVMDFFGVPQKIFAEAKSILLEKAREYRAGLETNSAPPGSVTGHYGGQLVERNVYKGAVHDARSFLRWLVTATNPEYDLDAFLAGFKQRGLDTLAKAVMDHGLKVPGFRAERVSQDVVR